MPDDKTQIRLVGPPEDVEAITRELRRGFIVLREVDYPSRRNPQHTRRYLTIKLSSCEIEND